MLDRQVIDDDNTKHIVSTGREENPAELATRKRKIKLTSIIVFTEGSNTQSV